MSDYTIDSIKNDKNHKRLGLPFSADDITEKISDTPDSVIIRTKIDDIDWIIIVSETLHTIKTTAIGVDRVSGGIDGMRSGYILHRSLPKPKKTCKRF